MITMEGAVHMLSFITKQDILNNIDQDIIKRKVNVTKRNGNSISLRPIVYNCIRAIYYEIFDYERVPSPDLTMDRSFYWTGPIGSTLHEKLQDLMGLTNQYYTERLMTFRSFEPLAIRSKCDGIDMRDPNNIILYELKTKNKIPSKPYKEELLQNLLSVFFFRNECNLNIRGSSMVYVLRDDPYNINFFNYDFFDKTSPIYIDVIDELSDTFDKVVDILTAMKDKRAPSMDNKHIKKFAYGRCQCNDCVYRDVCKHDDW